MSHPRQSDRLPALRMQLRRLEETGDLASPCIAGLKRIVLDRIAGIEAGGAEETTDEHASH